MSAFISRFAEHRGGATAIEYGLIAAMISVVLVSGLLLITPHIGDGYGGVAQMFPEIP